MKNKNKIFDRKRQKNRNHKVIILDDFRNRPDLQTNGKVSQEDEEEKLDDCSKELLRIFDDLFGPFEKNK